MATLTMTNFPFQGFPGHYNMDKPPRVSESFGYTPAAYRQTTPFRFHSPSLSSSSFNSTSSLFEPALKPSLPSISNLLDIANADRSAKGTESTESVVKSQPALLHAPQIGPQAQASPTIHQTTQVNPPTHRHVTPTLSQDGTRRPLSPFRRSDSAGESARSPSIISNAPSLPAMHPYLLPSMLNGFEKGDRQSLKRKSVTSHPDETPYKRRAPPSYIHSPYTTSPSAISTGSYYSPVESQRTLPGPPLPSLPSTSFPPPHAPPAVPSNPTLPSDPSAQPTSVSASTPSASALLPTSNPWEHHHYISPSSQASYPPSPDRYICPTCNKAFSRPSSLKIHSHSHTGEKPFKCPHAGCGKAFSVRSNMKRHEKGCHVGGTGAQPQMGLGLGVTGVQDL